MKRLIFFITMTVLLAACTPKFIKQYEENMIPDPTTQELKDKNLILQYLIDNELEYQHTESGIYYIIEKEGEGEGHPTGTDLVKTHYRGTLLDGKQFDSSYDRGEPIEFPLRGVIQGWQEAIPLLKPGGKGTFIIPSGLAYGDRAMGADIPANSVLKFDVELLDFYDPKLKAQKMAEAEEKEILDHLASKGIAGAKRTDSGIFYTIEREGSGTPPTPTSTVKVHYEGKLLDGSKFDSSYDRGNPIEFPLTRVIKGWQESVPLLKPGGMGTFYIPSRLGYGERGAGAAIPPNAILIFKVELLEVK